MQLELRANGLHAGHVVQFTHEHVRLVTQRAAGKHDIAVMDIDAQLPRVPNDPAQAGADAFAQVLVVFRRSARPPIKVPCHEDALHSIGRALALNPRGVREVSESMTGRDELVSDERPPSGAHRRVQVVHRQRAGSDACDE
jgi:hypothetical protein